MTAGSSGDAAVADWLVGGAAGDLEAVLEFVGQWPGSLVAGAIAV
jgi:hypothetical protein